MASDANKKKQFNTLLSTLANGSEIPARKLLKQHTGEDAQNTNDLVVKLSRLWANSTSKLDLEKEFADIHPHKNFILKYERPITRPALSEAVSEEDKGYGSHPMDENREKKIDAPVKEVLSYEGYLNATGGNSGYMNASGHAPCGSPNCPHCKRFFYEYSNCGGNPTCNCNQNKMSNACGCGGSSSFNGGGYSNADASQQSAQGMLHLPHLSQQTMIIGVIAVIGVLGLFMHMNKQKG